MFGISQSQIFIVLIIVLIIFGPKNLPRLARSLGGALRDFKSGLGGVEKDIDEAAEEMKRPVDAEARRTSGAQTDPDAHPSNPKLD
jgi:TatA/E family protein of Tat protein translocase